MTPSNVDYSYFDEDYFQDGEKRGTAFRRYVQNVAQAPWYREVAEHVAKIFKPKRALEVGCAIGTIVKHLNELGCETYGVDASEWAVANRVHPNVARHPAEKLPFPDHYFDVVFSSGTMEHLPPAVRDDGLKELDRVCKPDGYQFHMLPVVGEGPYRGDREAVLEGLRHDKTHFNLFERDEWQRLFAATGWFDTRLRCLYEHDTETFENSWCNFILHKTSPDPVIIQRVIENNIEVGNRLQLREREFVNRPFRFRAEEVGVLTRQGKSLSFDGSWYDFVASFSPPADLTNTIFRANVLVESTKPVFLRWGFLSSPGAGEVEDAHVLECWREYPPGHTLLYFKRAEMGVLRGEPNMASITKLTFGGKANEGVVRASLVGIRDGREQHLLS
jgi:ubiquinone/menaquinone biosynthesis C-methylase UbiE